MHEPVLIQLIADYGVGDPAFAEVTQKLTLIDPNSRVVSTSIPAFSTLATGFWSAQFALVNPIPGMVVYSNTSPRKDNKDRRRNNEGELLVCAVLRNGIKVVGVNAGYCYSFLKHEIQKMFLVNVANSGSQFRSRDYYPEAVIGLAKNNSQYIGKEVKIENIPDIPSNLIAHVDGYGNLKTTNVSASVKLQPGQRLKITINDVVQTVYYCNEAFAIREKQIAYAPGSSGKHDRFMEIFMRAGSAWEKFGRPQAEEKITIKILK